MAKRARSRRVRPGILPDAPGGNGIEPSVAAEVDPAVEALIKAVCSQPIADWGIFTTGKPIVAQAKKPDNTYRTVPLEGSEEFTFAGLYVGKRGKMIFTFHPIDPTYTQLEWDELKVFEACPALEDHIVKALGETTLSGEYEEPGMAYSAAASRFRANFRKNLVVQQKNAEIEKVKSNEMRMAENPLFGLF